MKCAPRYIEGRAKDFSRIVGKLNAEFTAVGESAAVIHGDSLEILKKIPDASISLVLTDPPYHSTKKHNIQGDRAFASDEHYLSWIGEYVAEWRRVLKPNGTLFLFCASEMAARIEIVLSKNFNILSQIVWTKPNEPGFDGWKQKMKKEAMRGWYNHSERILFASPAVHGNLFRESFADVLRTAREKAGLSQHALTGAVGAYGKVNHGGAVSNWEAGRNTPSREQYSRICEVIIGTGKVKSMPPYEDVIRAFNMDSSKEFTDVWTFPSVRPYRNKHPAEKPVAMLEHAIEAMSYPGDIILDCFAGSGSTGVAALRSGRRGLLVEIDERWVRTIVGNLADIDGSLGDSVRRSASKAIATTSRTEAAQLPFLLEAK